METNSNFLPIFEIPDDLAQGLRQIEIAKALAVGWYKGQFDYHLRKAGYVIMINGEEYYRPVSGLLYEQVNFFNKGTNGWHIAEWLKLIGLQEDDLREIQSIAYQDGVDGIYHSWKAKEGISSSQFKHNMEIMKELLLNVDEIQIDYENQRYKTSAYPTEPSRIYNTKESLYGDSLTWATGQQPFDITKWTEDGRIFELSNIQTKTVELAYGNTIRFYKLGIDVTSQYNATIKNAVQSMIMYSGNEFMQRTSSVKKSESTYTVLKYTNLYRQIPESDSYTSVVGTETFDATIKQTFIDDINDRHFIRYSVLKKIENTSHSLNTSLSLTKSYSESADILDGRSALTSTTYANNFWLLVGYAGTLNLLSILPPTLVNTGDEFLFYDTQNSDVGAYMKVSEFKKLSMDEIGYYIGEYFDIRVTVDDGGWFSHFINFLAKLLGMIHNFVFDFLYSIPIVRAQIQFNTRMVNKIFASDMEDKELYDLISKVGTTVVALVLSFLFPAFTIPIMLLSTAIQIAIAGGEAIDKQKIAEEEADKKKQEQKRKKEERKKEQETEEMRKRMDGDTETDEKEEFNRFLKDPLFKLKDEKRDLEINFKSKFKLL